MLFTRIQLAGNVAEHSAFSGPSKPWCALRVHRDHALLPNRLCMPTPPESAGTSHHLTLTSEPCFCGHPLMVMAKSSSFAPCDPLPALWCGWGQEGGPHCAQWPQSRVATRQSQSNFSGVPVCSSAQCFVALSCICNVSSCVCVHVCVPACVCVLRDTHI